MCEEFMFLCWENLTAGDSSPLLSVRPKWKLLKSTRPSSTSGYFSSLALGILFVKGDEV